MTEQSRYQQRDSVHLPPCLRGAGGVRREAPGGCRERQSAGRAAGIRPLPQGEQGRGLQPCAKLSNSRAGEAERVEGDRGSAGRAAGMQKELLEQLWSEQWVEGSGGGLAPAALRLCQDWVDPNSKVGVPGLKCAPAAELGDAKHSIHLFQKHNQGPGSYLAEGRAQRESSQGCP